MNDHIPFDQLDLDNGIMSSQRLIIRHFAYPNVKISQQAFIGCGRYAAFLPESVPPDQGYEPAAPKAIKFTQDVYPAVAWLAPESSASKKKIHEIKDRGLEKYFGNSQNLAYLLALISRSRELKIQGIQGDIWCTGEIVIDHNRPLLLAVEAQGFELKVKAFLSAANPDNLFLIPMPNAEGIADDVRHAPHVQMVSLAEFCSLSPQKVSTGKFIVTLSRDELPFLINLFFDKPEIQPDEIVLPGPNPYRGLLAFQERDAEVFFGREAYTKQLVEAVHQKSFVVVVGPSGSGKSSLVNAGLLSRLHQKGNWESVALRPGRHPLEALAAAILKLLYWHGDDFDRPKQIRAFARQLSSGKLTLSQVFDSLAKSSSDRQVLLIVDQFEEVYTLCPQEKERRQFIDALLSVTQKADSSACPNHILITLRADFWGKALAYRPLADQLQHAALTLGPMNRDELREVIERPAENYGVAVEDGLVERILDAVSDEPGDLPLLEFTLTKLWDQQRYRMLTHSIYDTLGGVEHALTQYAESVYAQLHQRERKQAQQIFMQLIQPGEWTEDIRRVATRTELNETTWKLVTKLADARLVVTDSTMVAATAEEPTALGTVRETEILAGCQYDTVELVHEALIRGWPRLREWMAADREFRLWQERLRMAIQQWKKSNEDVESLLRGVALAEAEFWLDAKAHALSAEEQRFVELSLQIRQRYRRWKWVRDVVMVLIGIVVGGMVSLGLVWLLQPSFLNKNQPSTGILPTLTPSPPNTPVPSPTAVPAAIPRGKSTLLRSAGLIVSKLEAQKIFELNADRKPLTYIANDFEVQGDVVVDHATGLMWERSGLGSGLGTPMTYTRAQAYVEDLNQQKFDGYDDWRLPTVPELLSLVDPEPQSNGSHINPVFNRRQWCWSADLATQSGNSPGAVWVVNFYSGYTYSSGYKSSQHVRAVRSI